MICRLCLNHPEGVLEIFRDNGEIVEGEVVKIVQKHFQIQIQFNDSVSNKICYVCWRYLNEFHKFWLNIKEKQQTLQSGFDCAQIKREEYVTADNVYGQSNTTFGAKTNVMCEPELNIDDVKGEPNLGIQEFDDDVGMNDDSPLLPLPDSEEILKVLLDVRGKMDALTTKMDRLNIEIISIRTEVPSNKSKACGEISIERKLVPRHPFSTLEELNHLEEKLKNEDTFKTFTNEMYNIGEKSFEKYIRRSWRAIFADNLAQQCSWRGTGTKKCVRDMLLTLAIRNAFTKKFALEESEFDRVSQKFFQYAHDRVAKVNKYLASKQHKDLEKA